MKCWGQKVIRTEKIHVLYYTFPCCVVVIYKLVLMFQFRRTNCSAFHALHEIYYSAWACQRSGVLFLTLSIRVSVCPSVLKLEKRYYWSEIDVTWYQYLLWWTPEVIRFCWHFTLTVFLQKKFPGHVDAILHRSVSYLAL